MSESKRGDAESAEDFAEKNRMVCRGEGGMAFMGYSFQSMGTQRFSPRSPRLSVSLNTDFDLGEDDFAHVVFPSALGLRIFGGAGGLTGPVLR